MRYLLLSLACFICFSTYTDASPIKVMYVGDEIPKHIKLNSHTIITNSDTLRLNHTILRRDIDYKFNSKFMRFELLLSTNSSDSLTVRYQLLPSWLKQKYGTALPILTPQSKKAKIYIPQNLNSTNQTSSDITMNGSKSFRFSTSKSGNAGFNQTLDLNLSGQLAKNLTLQGTISDRGYNPTYGTSNSRLNELDKINLRIESPNFKTEIGDITILSNESNAQREKKISGLHVALQNKNIQLGMIAARPKGQYRSVSLIGIINKQGPYQIKSDGARQAIIPGSETVWLDGIKLKRGTNDDYTLDYPNGQITFNVNHLIDSRSRIVVDFEPLSSEYKQKYLHATTNLYSTDTTYTFKFNWIREGDNQDENLSQSFSESDELLLASQSGDELVFKSGLLSDTLGAYELILDSLPDTIYTFVGEELGHYDVRFSFVEAGKGDYLYIGGNQYTYVGSNNGDYLPLILLRTPKQTDYLTSSFQIKNGLFGTLQTEWMQSRKINNLFANDVKAENENYYNLNYKKQFIDSKNRVLASYRKRENGFQERSRVNQADYQYDFYLPAQIILTSDEEILSLASQISLTQSFQITPEYSVLDYNNQFNAKKYSLKTNFRPFKKFSIKADVQKIKTKLTDTLSAIGSSNNLFLQSTYRISSSTNMTSSFNRIERTNNYTSILTGFTYDEYILKLSSKYSALSFQYYTEDSLSLSWQLKKKRRRLQFVTTNKFKLLDYKLQIHYQQIETTSTDDASLMTRANFTYDNRKKNLQIQSSYILSNETRFSKGIRYLQVNDGEGDYIFRDSQYVPEAGGDFIVVEELLSESADVKRGEKSFSVLRRWKKASLTYHSNIKEELFADESRSTAWIIPFYSNDKKLYLFYNRSEKASLKAFPIKGGHFFTVNILQQKEQRYINQLNRLKESLTLDFMFNQSVQKFYFEQKYEYFSNQRDQYYFRDGDVNGFALSGKIKKLAGNNDYAIQFKYRSSEDANLEDSKLYILLLENRFQFKKQTELKISSEFYKSNKQGSDSYLLTDNRPGSQGAIWSVIFRAKIKKEFRLNMTIQGRHSDSNQARIFARTEFVAQF